MLQLPGIVVVFKGGVATHVRSDDRQTSSSDRIAERDAHRDLIEIHHRSRVVQTVVNRKCSPEHDAPGSL
jgi:hypothetical protein